MWVTIFWVVIGLICLYLSGRHLDWSHHKFPSLQFEGEVAAVSGKKTGMKEFANEINKFVDNLNVENKRNHRFQSLGYFAAFLAALASFVVTLIE